METENGPKSLTTFGSGKKALERGTLAGKLPA